MTPAVIQLLVVGKRKAIADLEETKLAMKAVRNETTLMGEAALVTQKRTFAMNQALFTMRRIAYGLTLGILGVGAVALKMGFDFDKSVNQAQTAFKGFIPTTQGINKEIQQIFYLAAKTPFNFPEILTATQRLVPYNRNLKEVNSTVDAISNSLAAQGIANNQYLTRATIQFAHIYALGRVTGQQVNALARDNIPLTAMLAAHYHTTTAAITDMIHQGLIPASAATQALIEYQSKAGYANKNFMLATNTLSGAWATVKDILRFAVGRSEQGIFNSARKALQNVAKEMLPLVKANKPITVTMLAEALDKSLSPTTHIIINLFELFRGTLTGVLLVFGLFFKTIHAVSAFMNIFTGNGRVLRDIMFGIGFAIGAAAAAFVVFRIIMFGVNTTLLIANAITTAYNFTLIAYDFLMIAAATSTFGLVLALTALVAAEFLVIGALVVLYFKWKRFHDLVNKTARFLYEHWYLLALIPIIGPAVAFITVLARNWDHLYNSMMRVYNLAVKIKNFFFGAKGHSKKWYQKSGLDLIRGAFASGGVASMGGSYLVGEQGPEIVHLPRGAAVTPNASLAGGMAGAFSLTIEPADVNIDGRKVTEIVFKHKLDRIARR